MLSQPQIIYNAVMGTRDALSHTYFIGTAVCRLLLPLYALGCPRSMFGIALDGLLYSPKSCMVLTLWTVVQIVVLLLQDALGPRFFVPKYMLPVRYDYYRPLSSIHPLGATASVVEVLEDGRARQLPECVICYCAVDGGERHMITPCDHVFHEHCLTRWMAVKLDCPVCRHAIPSIE